MPLYEYRCPFCGHRFEVLQRVGQDASELSCPACGRLGPEKEHSTFASGAGARTTGASSCASGRFT